MTSSLEFAFHPAEPLTISQGTLPRDYIHAG
jgi:hypothetical protein